MTGGWYVTRYLVPLSDTEDMGSLNDKECSKAGENFFAKRTFGGRFGSKEEDST